MHHHRPILPAVLFGLASIVLYALLFQYSDLLVDWAKRTKQGEKLLFLVPVTIAFLFSWIHGSFTGHFWEVLGLRAAKSGAKKK